MATKKETANGEYIFFLRITLEEAVYTSLYFNKYFLSEGPEITFLDTNGVYLTDYYPYDFDYNPEKPEDGCLLNAIPPDAIIKFTCKKNIFQNCILNLEQVFYVYKDFVSEFELKTKENASQQSKIRKTSSQSCNFDIPCFNSYTDWFNQINSVVQISIIYTLGSTYQHIYSPGVLLNTPDFYNYDNSKKPFVLTAAHLLDQLRIDQQNINNVLKNTRLYLLYQNTICGNNNNLNPPWVSSLNLIFEGAKI